jgi:pseudoazurin
MSVPGAVKAETFEMRMPNRGVNGSMVFEPEYVELTPGDTLQFRVEQCSHDAAFIDGLAPDGYEGFKRQIEQDIAVTFDRPGFYCIKCSPRLGMVMLVKVGEAALPDGFVDEVPSGTRKKQFRGIGARAGLTTFAPRRTPSPGRSTSTSSRGAGNPDGPGSGFPVSCSCLPNDGTIRPHPNGCHDGRGGQ